MTPNEIIHVNWFLQYGAPFLSGAFGVGVAWGIVREKIKSFERQHGILEKRVIKNEGKLEFQVGNPRCDRLRDECQNRVYVQLKELKADIKEIRTIVLEKIEEQHEKQEEIFRFIGRATEVIHQLRK